MKATGAKTKKETVEAAMRLTVQLKAQEGIKELFGKVRWEGDLGAMRQSRFPEWDEGRRKKSDVPDSSAA
ncbi:MAG: type II toxin-antitoxin system VapB family antitoxin [Terracidiphilus sp.]